MNKRFLVKDLKIGMCLSEPVLSENNEIIFNADFYFTSQDQIQKLLDYGIKNVEVELTKSLIDEDPNVVQHQNPIDKFDNMDPLERIDKASSQIEEIKATFDTSVQVVDDLITSARYGRALNHKAIREETLNILSTVKKDPIIYLSLLDLKNFDGYTYAHSVNVSILSVAFAHQLRFSEEKLHYISEGSLLHDVGKAKIPLEIINKPGKLTDDEMLVMQQHPLYGLEILEKEYKLHPIVREIVLHHHEDYDCGGYPHKLGGKQMKRFASIAAVCDFYDAVTSKRSYKSEIPPANAIKLILSLSGTKFDPRVANWFVRTVGIYPIGSQVELNDGRTATVVSFSKSHLLQPLVKINPPHHQEVISLSGNEVYIINVLAGTNKKTYEIYKK